jgi:hypothetical protein
VSCPVDPIAWQPTAGVLQRPFLGAGWLRCLEEREMANGVEINATAPKFSLVDWQGQPVCLSDFRGRYHVMLVFNRGFM